LRTLAEAPPNHLVIDTARIQGARIHLTLRNGGTQASPDPRLTLTTRAGGFMIGTASHPVAEFASGASRELDLPLPVWVAERADLLSVITQRGCCTTRVVLFPGHAERELSHFLPLPLEPAVPAAEEPQ
jgi:hypothetical protein